MWLFALLFQVAGDCTDTLAVSGRWVAAMSWTATARPRRPIESLSPVASGAASVSSAYSSTRMISAGRCGLGSQTRSPAAPA